MLRVDANDIPCLVQRVKFDYSHYWAECETVTGAIFRMEIDCNRSGITIMSQQLSDIQIQDLYDMAERYACRYWAKLSGGPRGLPDNVVKGKFNERSA